MKVELAGHLGAQDVVIGSLHEIVRNGISLPTETWKAILTARGLSSLIIRLGRGVPFMDAFNASAKYKYFASLTRNPAHPPASCVKAHFPFEWSTYYKFAFVRNPWERLVSDYYWRRSATGGKFSFYEYLLALYKGVEDGRMIHSGNVSNLDIITIDGSISVDFLGRYETLREDFQWVGDHLGLDLDLKVHEKSGSSGVEYKSLYGRKEKTIADILVKDECEALGYEFPY